VGNSPCSFRPANSCPVIATSGPSSVWPKKAYRNPTDQLVKFLDDKHQTDWSIFEFRAEGTGYPDSEVYNRIHHFPWPDHHPPPFAIIPALMASMRNWVQGEGLDGTVTGKSDQTRQRRVAVVHCKAGKGRSGTAACSYLISEEGWNRADALQRFTDRRMRVGFGNGVSIPSQLRWVGYVDRWTNQMNKRYVDRPVEIVELHVWGLREGVKVTVEGYVENGRQIQCFHIFKKDEKIVVDDGKPSVDQSKTSQVGSLSSASCIPETGTRLVTSPTSPTPQSSTYNLTNGSLPASSDGATVLLKPSSPIILPTSDINIDFERRNRASYTGWTMVTSVAHVWLNTYFEGGHEGNDSGVFEIEWEAMDGIKGSARKGTKAIDRLKVLWRYASTDKASMQSLEKVITQPARGEPVPEPEPADWRGDKDKEAAAEASPSGGVSSGRPGGALLTMGATIVAGVESLGKDLGLRKADPKSAEISRANSVRETSQSPTIGKDSYVPKDDTQNEDEDTEGVRARGPEGEETISYKKADGMEATLEETEGKVDTRIGRAVESGVEKMGDMLPGRTKTTNSRNGHRKEEDV
jgi:protein-tyrosine phosphatase